MDISPLARVEVVKQQLVGSDELIARLTDALKMRGHIAAKFRQSS